MLAFLRGLCILYLSLIEITLCKFVETSLVAQWLSPRVQSGGRDSGSGTLRLQTQDACADRKGGTNNRKIPVFKITRHSLSSCITLKGVHTVYIVN